jgi:hypothetical protein
MDEIELPLRCHARRFLFGSYSEWKSGQEELDKPREGIMGPTICSKRLPAAPAAAAPRPMIPKKGGDFSSDSLRCGGGCLVERVRS